MTDLKTEPRGYGDILWEHKHHLWLPVILFGCLTVIIYSGLLIHIYVVELAVYSTPAIETAIANNPNWQYPTALVLWFIWLLAAVRLYQNSL